MRFRDGSFGVMLGEDLGFWPAEFPQQASNIVNETNMEVNIQPSSPLEGSLVKILQLAAE
jgi:hypothetical protein